MELHIDYISDLHLAFYIKNLNKETNTTQQVTEFIDRKIKPQAKSPLLIIAGDINENNNVVIDTVNACTKYYHKVIFILGNHEYYIYNKEMQEKYQHNSSNKISELNEVFNNHSNIIFLDKTNTTNGLITYNGFTIAGDTFWYKPNNIKDWLYNYPTQRDSSWILSELSKKDKILKLHNDSMNWYNNLPNNIDLIISHIPPFRNENNNRGNNECYYNNIKEYKSPIWIYGHDHQPADITINNTRLVSNPWGYNSKKFPVKSLILKK